MDIKEALILGEKIELHWYYVSKMKALCKLIENIKVSKILDVGAGSGFFSKQLLKIPSVNEAICVDTSYEADTNQFINNKSIHFRRSVDFYDADLVLLMDVLEHVDDDISLLKNYSKKVPKGTHFLISVPAFQFLWSNHDVFLEHKRRYNLMEIKEVIRKSGMNIVNGNYFFSLVFPIALTLRMLEKLKFNKKKKLKSQLQTHNWLINFILLKICNIEFFF